MLNTNFRGNRTLVPVKKIFEGFSPHMGMVAILVMSPASYQQIFISMYLKANIQKMVKNSPVVSEKSILAHLS